jgi:hypothetical protein
VTVKNIEGSGYDPISGTVFIGGPKKKHEIRLGVIDSLAEIRIWLVPI